jgi:hypothetical protein
MTALLTILAGTPWWVFLLLALLIGLGVQALRPRRVGLRRVFITPGLFIGWGLVALAATAQAMPLVLPAWAAAAAIGGALALATTRLSPLRIDRDRGQIELPGSAAPLARNMIIFLAKYGLAVAMATHPAAAQLHLWDMAVSGMGAGYFAGWTFRFLARYRQDAVATPLTATSAG